MAAGYPWAFAETGDSNVEHPDVTYWRERAFRAERQARHNHDLAEFARDVALAALPRAAPTTGEGKTG